MRKINCLAALLVLISTIHLPDTSQAMVDPEIIAWGSSDAGVFLTSVYQATLGRDPNQADWDHAGSFNGKLQLFLSVVGSREYQEKFGYLERKFFVYWKKQFPTGNGEMGPCNCYYVAENSDGLVPNMQFTGVTLPPGKHNFPVARALAIMCATFDDETCQVFECGLAYDNSPGGIADQGPTGGGLVLDPDFAAFGAPNGPWGCDGLGTWWGDARCTVDIVSLDDGPARTALHIVNRTPRKPGYYGTTGQRIAVRAGHTYEIGFYAQARGLGSKGAITITIDPQWSIQPVKLAAGTYQWTKFSGTFVAPTGEIELRILSQDQGEVWLTGMSLVER